jgi:hypothetical protein
MKALLASALMALLLSGADARADTGDCTGTPPDAVTTLPAPLDKWATMVCTPYGHIISNKNGWIWSYPGTYAPVFVPAQMVEKAPAEVGNKIYFTKISFEKDSGPDFQTAYKVFGTGFAPDKKIPDGYRLEATSVTGSTLMLYLFDYGTYAWGIWCGMNKFSCDPKTRFMIMDMSHKPQ